MELTKTPSFRLDGRRALVTGAGRGIGLAAASALADAGAHVALAARTTTEIAEAANAIRARGQQADPLTLDVRDVEAVKTTIAAQEPFDILVNNAGTNRPAPFVDVKVEDFDFVFGLNVRGAYFLAQAVARRLIGAKKSGSIINMSSQMGHVGGPNPHRLLRYQARDGRLHQSDGDRVGTSQDPRQHAGADFHRDADDAARANNPIGRGERNSLPRAQTKRKIRSDAEISRKKAQARGRGKCGMLPEHHAAPGRGRHASRCAPARARRRGRAGISVPPCLGQGQKATPESDTT